MAVAAVLVALGVLAFGPAVARAAYSGQVTGSTLVLTGNNSSDKLALRLQSGSPNTLEVDVGDNGTADMTFDRTAFTGITVNAGGGNDLVRIDQSNGSFTDESIVVDGGAGNDTLIGGSGAEVFLGGDGNDVVDGNQGNDTALLGAGKDTFHWDPGDGSDTVEGQDGADTLEFSASNVSEQIALAPNGSRVLLTRDVGAITTDLNGIERFLLKLGGGTDTVTVNDLVGTDAKEVDVDLDAFGGGGDGQADSVVQQGTSSNDAYRIEPSKGDLTVSGGAALLRVHGSEPASDTLSVNGGDGADTITAVVGSAGASAIDIDGGNNTDVTRIEGTKHDDTIAAAASGSGATISEASTSPVNAIGESLWLFGLEGNDTISTSGDLASVTNLIVDGGKGNDAIGGGNGADILLGGDGNDVVDGHQGSDLAFLGKGNDTFHWDPGDGSDTLEGQDGTDTLDFSGANIGEHVEVQPNGSRILFTRDVGSVATDVNGVEQVAYHARGGADTVTVDDLTGTDAKGVAVDLAAVGGGGDGAADSVIVNGTSAPDKVKVVAAAGGAQVTGLHAKVLVTGSEPASDLLQLNTLAGDDTVTLGSGLGAVIQVAVDLGPDS